MLTVRPSSQGGVMLDPRLADLGRRPRDRARERVAGPSACEVQGRGTEARLRRRHGLLGVQRSSRAPLRACRSPPVAGRRSSARCRCHTRDMRNGCYDSIARLEDMDRAGVLASLCFPSFPRFCGQAFSEIDDADLAMVCIRAYKRLDDRGVVRVGTRPLHPARHHPVARSRRRCGRDGAVRGDGPCTRSRSRRTVSRSAFPPSTTRTVTGIP